MSVTAVAAAGTAVALYLYGRRGAACTEPLPAERETHAGLHSAPTTLLEDLFFLAEGLRYTYGETLGRWRTADLLIGLAYLCRKEPDEHPVADIAQLGRPFGRELAAEQWPEALTRLRELERFFRYCSGLRERRPLPQRHYFRSVLGVTDDDLLMQELRAGVLKPSFVLVRDRQLRAVVLAIRGTHSFKDMFTSLTGASKPHHLVDANGVVLGYSHFGMLAAARWIKGQTRQRIEQALADNPGFSLKILGHSLGGGTAALLAMMLREAGGPFAGVTCTAIACPSCMTLELAQSCSDYVTTVVHNADVIPTICPGSADALREEVMRSSWFGEFRRDVRATGIVRAVESGLRGVGSATRTATSWTSSKIALCYQRGSFGSGSRRRQALKRRNSDDDLAAAAATEGRGGAAAPGESTAGGDDAAESAVMPLSTSAPAGSSGSLLAEAAAAAAAGDADPAAGGGWGARLGGTSAAVLSSTSHMLRSTSGALRSTSGLFFRRVWPGAEPAEAEPAAAGSAAAGDGDGSPRGSPAADAAPGPVRIESSDSDYDAADDGGMELDGDDSQQLLPEAGPSRRGGRPSYSGRRAARAQLQRTGSLEEEMSQRMHEVQQAVHDAEEEEAASGAGDSTVPSVIRPGGWGIDGGGGGGTASPRISPSKRDPRWKRQMYPAGRIMHLVPARLVPGTAAHSAAAAAAAAAATAAQGEQAAAGADGQAAGGSAAADGASGHPSRPHHAARLSVSDLMAGEEMISPRSAAAAGWVEPPQGDGGAGPPSAGAAAAEPQQQQPQEQMVLLDSVPQEAYARIKLCRTVLSDHIIPNYLRALESALEHMQEHAAAAGAAPDPDARPPPAGSTEAAAAGNPPTPAASAAAAAAVPARPAAAASAPVGSRSGKQD